MALKPCRECKQAVSTTAKQCPGCGSPAPTGPSAATIVVRTLGLVFGGIFALLVAVAFIAAPSRNADGSSGARPASLGPAPSAPPEEQPIEIDARSLWAAYDANEVAADNQYKGHKLLVTGVVSKIDKDFLGNIVLWLKTGNEFEKVMAKMDSAETNQAARLSRHTKVAVLCEGGDKILGSPTLHECRFQ